MAPKVTYQLADVVPHDVLTAYDELTRTLLYNRDIHDAEAAETFLAPDYETGLHDPWLLTDMDRAVSRILEAVAAKEHIAIYSDYDCDGIPGGVVLHDFFRAIEHEQFENYIPHRHDEGFGFNVQAVDVLHERGVTLIITIDCGTVDHAAVDAAREKGIDVIITDHHLPAQTGLPAQAGEAGNDLPNAYAVINPKRDTAYPFRELCGAGVVYKLVQALLARGEETKQFSLTPGWEKWLLDMVGLATIADMVPLVGENRVLAHYGLLVLRKSRRPGLQHLLRKTRANQRQLTEDDIGFTIGPRINAASRMDTPEDAFHMLATTDEADAGARVAHLEKLNNERKGVVAAMSKELKKRIATFTEIPNVIVIGNPEWRPALVGLSANSLVDTYKRPVFLWGRDGRGVIKGSCRSDGNTSVVALMEAAKENLIEFGGHHGSGGFSVTDTDIHTLSDALNAAYTKISTAIGDDAHTQIIDADIALDAIDDSLITTLRALGPYGTGNAKPLFRLTDVTPIEVTAFGKAKEHTRIVFDTKNGRREAIAFFKTPDQFAVTPVVDTPMTLVGHIEESFFMGRRQIRIRIVDIIPS